VVTRGAIAAALPSQGAPIVIADVDDANLKLERTAFHASITVSAPSLFLWGTLSQHR